MGYLELMLMNNNSSITVCDLVKPKDIVSRGFNEIEEMHDAEHYFERGMESYKNKIFNEALCWFRKALQVDPDHENSLFNSGVCYIPSNCHLGFSLDLYGIDETVCSRRAVKCLERLIDLRKNRNGLQASDSGAFNNLGCAYGNLGEDKKEEEAFRTAITLDEKNARAYDNLGIALFYRSLLDEAENFCTTAFNTDKDYLPAHFHLGMIYEKKMQNQDALKWYRSFLEKVDRTDTWRKENIRNTIDAIDRLKKVTQ